MNEARSARSAGSGWLSRRLLACLVGLLLGGAACVRSPDPGADRGDEPDGAARTDEGLAIEVGPGECLDPVPLVLEGQATGVVVCASGALNRARAGRCPVRPPNLAGCLPVPAADGGLEEPSHCRVDTDCAARPHGRCDLVSGLEQVAPPVCACVYDCGTDEDCREGETCVCIDGFGRCVTSECRTGADCPSGQCGVARTTYGYGERQDQVACRTQGDACRTDCGATDECVPTPTGWQCHCVHAGCGPWVE